MHKPTVADIFRAGFESFVQTAGSLPYDHYKAVHAIMVCRTEELGGHVYSCASCGHEKIQYNSCGNRHCPQCQARARINWVQDRIDELLPVPYFHVVFTLPSELNPFALRNKEAFYSLMFRAASETLRDLSEDRKHLGAEIGFILVKHTWGQNLMDHPHIHGIIPGGGIVHGDTRWKPSKKTFLFPIRAMSALFRGKLMDYFKKAVKNKKIDFHGSLAEYDTPRSLTKLTDSLYEKYWVVYAKQPFAGPEAVIKYLGNYTHRIAISNHRIVSVQNGLVTFAWKDYADKNKRKEMTVTTQEFIRRFLLHIVPKGFMRIRHYGFLSNRCRKSRLVLCKKLLDHWIQKEKKKNEKMKWQEVIETLTGKNPRLCPVCNTGIMVLTGEIPKPRFRLNM